MGDNNNSLLRWVNGSLHMVEILIIIYHQLQNTILQNDQQQLKAENITHHTQYGSTQERFRRDERNQSITRYGILGVIAAVVFFGGKTVNNLRQEMTSIIATKIEQLQQTSTSLQTAIDNANDVITELQNQIHNNHAQQAKMKAEMETKIEGIQAEGGRGEGGRGEGGRGEGGNIGNINLGSGLFDAVGEARRSILNSQIDERLSVSIRPFENDTNTRITELNNRLNGVNDQIIELRRNNNEILKSTWEIKAKVSINEAEISNLNRRKSVSSRSSQGSTSHNQTKSHGSPQLQTIFPQSTPLDALSRTDQSIKELEAILKKKTIERNKLIAEKEKVDLAQLELLKTRPPESDAAIKNKPFSKEDDSDHDDGGNPGLGAGSTSQVEVNFVFIPNYLTNNVITKLSNFSTDFLGLDFNNKLFKYNQLVSKNYIKPIYAKSHFNYKNQLNSLNFNKNNNLNNNLNSNLDSNSNSYLEKEIDITIINSPIETDINSKLVTIISNDGTSVSSSSLITNNIDKNIIDSKLTENSKLIKPSEVIKINKTLNNDLHSYPIKDIEIEKSLYESEQKLELIKLRKAMHSEWLNSNFKSNPLPDQDINEFLIEEEQVINIKAVNELDLIQQPKYLVNKDLVNYNINLNKTNNSLYLNDNVLNLTQIFVSHKLYVDFIDLIFCELFFVNEIINTNISCFIYGSLFVPTLFILNGLGYMLNLVILITTFNLISNGFNLILQNNLNQTNYKFIKNILNKLSSILFNTLFLYIVFINLNNIGVFSGLILLKSVSLFGNPMVKQLVSNKTLVSNKKVVINNNSFINIYIYKTKHDINYESVFY